MPSFLVPALIHKQNPLDGKVPPICPQQVVSVSMTRRLGDSPLPSTLVVSFRLTLNGEPLSPIYTTQSWPVACDLDLRMVPPGAYALSCQVLSDDPLYQPFAVPMIVGAVQPPGVVPACPGYMIQGIRRNEGATPAFLDLGAL